MAHLGFAGVWIVFMKFNFHFEKIGVDFGVHTGAPQPGLRRSRICDLLLRFGRAHVQVVSIVNGREAPIKIYSKIKRREAPKK